MSAPLKLTPVMGVNVYRDLPKEYADTLKHSDNDDHYPHEMYHALHRQRHHTADNTSNVIFLF